MNSITRLPSRCGLTPPMPCVLSGSAASEPRGSEAVMNNYFLFPLFLLPELFHQQILQRWLTDLLQFISHTLIRFLDLHHA